MNDEHVIVKDAAQGVVQNVAVGVSGAAENGGVKAFILPIVIFQRRRVFSKYTVVAPG